MPAKYHVNSDESLGYTVVHCMKHLYLQLTVCATVDAHHPARRSLAALSPCLPHTHWLETRTPGHCRSTKSILEWHHGCAELQVWSAHVHTKRALFAGIAQQHNAAVQMADDECGNALACLQVCTVAKSVIMDHASLKAAVMQNCRVAEANLSGAEPMLHPDSSVSMAVGPLWALSRPAHHAFMPNLNPTSGCWVLVSCGCVVGTNGQGSHSSPWSMTPKHRCSFDLAQHESPH